MKETIRYCDECYDDTQQYESRRKEVAEYFCDRCGRDLCRTHMHTLSDSRFCDACLSVDPRLKRAAELITEVEQLIRAAHHAVLSQVNTPPDATPPPAEPTLQSLYWSVRATKAFERARITTLSELTEFTAEKLLSIKGLGSTTLWEIEEKLKKQGLSLKEEG